MATTTEAVCRVCLTETEGLVSLPCEHLWCPDCIRTACASVRGESDWPMNCGELCHLPLDMAVRYLSADGAQALSLKAAEFETKPRDRAYCSNKDCRVFIPVWDDETDVITCKACGTESCRHCSCSWHQGECVDTETLDLGQIEAPLGCQACSECGRVIERTEACPHMTCVCGFEFCIHCGSDIRDCNGCGQLEYGDEDEDQREGEDEAVFLPIWLPTLPFNSPDYGQVFHSQNLVRRAMMAMATQPVGNPAFDDLEAFDMHITDAWHQGARVIFDIAESLVHMRMPLEIVFAVRLHLVNELNANDARLLTLYHALVAAAPGAGEGEDDDEEGAMDSSPDASDVDAREWELDSERGNNDSASIHQAFGPLLPEPLEQEFDGIDLRDDDQEVADSEDDGDEPGTRNLVGRMRGGFNRMDDRYPPAKGA